MSSSRLVYSVIFSFCLVLLLSCGESATKTEETPVTVAPATEAAITNPNFTIAPVEYAELAEKTFQLLASLDIDAWGATMADSVAYSFPDGDVATRTTLKGKDAVLNWWKNWKATSGIQSMAVSEFNLFPLNATGTIKGGAAKGIHVIAYLSNKMVFDGKPVDIRMNFALHFNDDKKIDRVISYYDRSVLIKVMGKNVLAK
jgi:ketosteroid isomerase-like protein